MPSQLDLFSGAAIPPEHWWSAWGWDGPEVGGYIEVGDITARKADGDGHVFCYMEQCKVIEAQADGSFLAEICMGLINGVPWHKDGTRIILERDQISAPTMLLRKSRMKP
jgi:hypothetical protein